MSLGRAATGILCVVCVIGLSAIGQEEKPDQAAPKTQLEICRAAMPAIFKNYNNAKYAVFRAANTGDFAHMGGPVREAQAALDAMEQPLKACYEAMQKIQPEQQPDHKE